MLPTPTSCWAHTLLLGSGFDRAVSDKLAFAGLARRSLTGAAGPAACERTPSLSRTPKVLGGTVEQGAHSSVAGLVADYVEE
jgi:hypothetical protein